MEKKSIARCNSVDSDRKFMCSPLFTYFDNPFFFLDLFIPCSLAVAEICDDFCNTLSTNLFLTLLPSAFTSSWSRLVSLCKYISAPRSIYVSIMDSLPNFVRSSTILIIKVFQLVNLSGILPWKPSFSSYWYGRTVTIIHNKNICLGLQQDLHNILVPHHAGQVQGSVAITILQVRLCPSTQ